MKYFPLNDYVIVQKLVADRTTSSGIILQTSTGSDTAKVIAVADDVDGITIGNTLIIRWSNALKVDGDTYAVSSKEIVCKIEE
jgi:co-chaperonin GroES (HSP10)